MGKITKEYPKSGKLVLRELSKIDLQKLVALIREGFPAFDDEKYRGSFSISTDLNNISISADNIESFLESDELPNKLNKLNIRIYDYDSKNEVWLFINNRTATLEVKGIDQIWVLGGAF